MNFPVESVENQQMCFSEKSLRGHLILVQDRFETFSQYFHQLILMNKPETRFYSFSSPKIKLSELAASGNKKGLIELWLSQKVVVEKFFTNKVNYYINFTTFFRSLRSFCTNIFIDEQWKTDLSDCKIDYIQKNDDYQLIFKIIAPNEKWFFVRMIKKWNLESETIFAYESLFKEFKNISDDFLKVHTIISHPGFFILVYDFCPMRNLYDIIYSYQSQKYTLSEMALCSIVKQILSAMESAKECGSVLFAIKPENIFLKNLEKVVISRFSKSQINQKAAFLKKRFVENSEYMPPEMIKNEVDVSFGADYWYLGIFM